MPLSAPAPREPLHARHYDFHGYQRADGLWDIEGHMTDTKTYPVPNQWRGEIKAGEPIHDMWIRLTLDGELVVQDIEVATGAGPFAVCGDITPKYAAIKGARVGPGWRARIKELFGGTGGCTHHTEMLGAMATVAFQTIYSARKQWDKADAGKRRPAILDTCHALASDSEVVKRLWPEFYTGGERAG